MEGDLEANRLYAWVELAVRQRHCETDIISDSERAQLRFWEASLGPSLENGIVFFDVRRLVSLKREDGLYPQLASGPALRRRGNHMMLNNVERAHCHREGVAPADLSHLCLRVPAPFALLIASGRWTVLALTDDVNSARCGPFDVPWATLALNKPPCRVVYPQEGVQSFLDYQAIADAIRIAFRGAETEEERSRLSSLVVSAQAMADDSDPDVFRRRVMRSGPSMCPSRRRYRSDYLLKIFMTLSRLRGTTHLPPLFREVCTLMFSDSTLQHLDALISECAALVPSKSTISRARLLLDCSFLLWIRRYNASLLADGGCVRYLMADSSSQHGREFEATWLLTVKKGDLLAAVRAFDQLIALRKEFDESGVQENLEEDERLTALLEAYLCFRQAFPPLALGGGQGALSDKFHSVMLALFHVGAGVTPDTRVPTFIAFVRSIISCTGDAKQQKQQQKQKHKQHQQVTWAQNSAYLASSPSPSTLCFLGSNCRRPQRRRLSTRMMSGLRTSPQLSQR